MKHVMVDIETLGTGRDSIVTSIGAKSLFSDDEFYHTLDWSQQAKKGRKIDPSTVRWWLNQSQEAQSAIVQVGDDVGSVLESFVKFCKPHSDCYIWANSPSFDVAILRSLFKDFGVAFPVSFANELDFRTMKNLAAFVKPEYEVQYLKDETAHDALGDAKSQAHALENIFLDMFSYKGPEKKKTKPRGKKKKPTPSVAEPKKKPEASVELPPLTPATFEDVQAALKAFALTSSRERGVEIINSYGADNKLSNVKPEDYQAILDELEMEPKNARRS